MGITKKFLKSKPVCKVTFSVPKELVASAESVYVVGEFNDWNPASTPLKEMKNGTFSTTLDLEQGREYQFRYLIDGTQWTNETEADKFAASPFADATNSVVVL